MSKLQKKLKGTPVFEELRGNQAMICIYVNLLVQLQYCIISQFMDDFLNFDQHICQYQEFCRLVL